MCPCHMSRHSAFLGWGRMRQLQCRHSRSGCVRRETTEVWSHPHGGQLGGGRSAGTEVEVEVSGQQLSGRPAGDIIKPATCCLNYSRKGLLYEQQASIIILFCHTECCYCGVKYVLLSQKLCQIFFFNKNLCKSLIGMFSNLFL